jgi:hypothetical protein
MEFCWLLELPGGRLYLHTARSETSCGFTSDVYSAQRFPTREAAEAERDALNGAFGAQPVEHGFAKAEEKKPNSPVQPAGIDFKMRFKKDNGPK